MSAKNNGIHSRVNSVVFGTGTFWHSCPGVLGSAAGHYREHPDMNQFRKVPFLKLVLLKIEPGCFSFCAHIGNRRATEVVKYSRYRTEYPLTILPLFLTFVSFCILFLCAMNRYVLSRIEILDLILFSQQYLPLNDRDRNTTNNSYRLCHLYPRRGIRST